MKLYVWGTGRLTGKVLGKYLDIKRVTAFVDNDERKQEWLEKPVIRPAELVKRDYDAVIVITLHSAEIYQQSRALGLDLKKMIFLYQNVALKDFNQDYQLVEQIFGRDYADIVKSRYHLVRGVETRHSLCLKDEYSRGGVLQNRLCAHEVLRACCQGNQEEERSRRRRRGRRFPGGICTIHQCGIP